MTTIPQHNRRTDRQMVNLPWQYSALCIR